MGLSKVQISWFGLEREAILANDVAWCKVKPAILQCQGEIHILRRKGNMNQTVLHADTIDQALDDVIFGVAAISDKNVSSGIKWQEECRYVKDAVPRPVQTKPLLPDPPKNSLVVSWIPLKCDSGASNNAYIKMYQIIYCQLNTHGSCKGGEFSVNVPADNTTQYTLRNLEADTEYGVWVQAMSLTKEGHKSKMVSGRPTNDDLPDASIAGIAIGEIFVLVLVIAGFVCVCRQVKRKLGLDETFDIENIQVRRFENLPTGSNLYNLITTPADRSSSPLITPNGTTSNGNIRHNGINHSYVEILPLRSTVDLDEENGSGEQKDSKPDLKSNVVTLAITDVPRQISKDSGHGSLSPTSTHAPPTSEESDKKENFLRDIISDLPPDYPKTTSVTTQCVHDNNDKQQFEESSKKNPEDNELERSRKEELENKVAEVEQTSGYVFYQPNGTETTMGNQTNNVQPKDSLSTCNISKTTTEQQPYNVQFKNTLPTSTQTISTNQPNSAKIQCSNIQNSTVDQLNCDQSTNGPAIIHETDMCQTYNQLRIPGYHPYRMLNTEHQTTDMDSGPQLLTTESEQFTDYLPHDTNFEELTASQNDKENPSVSNCVVGNTTDLSVMNSVPHGIKSNVTKGITDNATADRSDYVPKGMLDYVPNGMLDYVPNGTSNPLPSGKTSDLPVGTSDYVSKDMNYFPSYVPDDTTDSISSDTKDYVPCSPSCYVPNDTTNYVPNGTTDYVPNGATNYVPNGTTNYVLSGTADYVPNDTNNYVPNGT